MLNQKEKRYSRVGLALLILLSGLAFMPLAELSGRELGWQLFAGIYEPDLEVNHDKGAPGAAFLFTATNFPANTGAYVYANGEIIGQITTDDSGSATFLIQTTSSDDLGRYMITVATDTNNAASTHFDLEDDEPRWPPPDNFEGIVFGLTPTFQIYLPFIARS